MHWSINQEAVFDFVSNGTGNAIVKAVAGSGKTTTIVEAIKRVRGVSIFLAFNKSIAEELKARGVNARTFHSLTYSPVLQNVGVRTVEANKTDTMMDYCMSVQDRRVYGSFVRKLVSLAKQAGIDAILPNDWSEYRALVDHHGLSIDTDDADIDRGIELAREVLEISNTSACVDFDDMLYLAVRNGITLSKYDWVFVDEAQDTNAIQRALLRKILKPDARIVAVGDPAQAIYGFRGSDSNSMNLIRDEFNCIELPLTVSYRCPQNIVKHAHKWVDYIEAFEGAAEGTVNHKGKDWTVNDFQPNDLIVCRNVKPMITIAYRMLKSRSHKPYFLGKDIGQGLKSLVGRMRAKGIDHLLKKIDAWFHREYEKAIAAKKEAHAAAIEDKYETMLALCSGLDENNRTIPALLGVIDDIFDVKRDAVMLATVHKAKGLEAERVWWLNSSKMPSPYAKKDWQLQQESNLCYVATTRAKQELNLIEE